MPVETASLSARAVRRLDILLVVWIVVWAAVGILVWHDVRAQSGLPGDVVTVGRAVKSTGDALGVVGGLPLVGGSIAEFADRIQTMGADVVTDAEASQAALQRSAVVAGLGAWLLPVALLAFLYVPVRVRWSRQLRAVTAALRSGAADPAFEQYLARSAIAVLPWDQLRAITPDPWGDVARGEYRALAAAELERLGLERP